MMRSMISSLNARPATLMGLPSAQTSGGGLPSDLQAVIQGLGRDAAPDSDPTFQAALKNVQAALGVPATGQLDDQTLQALLRLLQILASANAQGNTPFDQDSDAAERAVQALRSFQGGGGGARQAPMFGSKAPAGTVPASSFQQQRPPPGSGGAIAPTTTPADVKSVQQSASRLLELEKQGRVKFWDGLSSGSDKKNIERLAAGQPAFVPATGQQVTPSPKLMQALVSMAERGPITINALTGGQHSSGSNHYKGTAVDLDVSSGLGASNIEAVAAQYGGRRNSERDHIHLDF